MCYIKGFIRYKNTAFSLNYSTDISLRCCKVSRVLQLCSTAFLIIEISEFNRLIARLLSFKDYESCRGFSSVQFSCSVVSNSLRPHESQHARPPRPSPTHRVHSDSRPSSPWCHPAISSSVVPFSSAANPSQHQSLFQWVNSSHEVAKVLEFQL